MKTHVKPFRIVALLIAVAFVASACESSFDSLVEEQITNNPLPTGATYSSGSADYSNIVSIGASITAGLMDGALYNQGQAHSFPNLMAKALEPAGAGVFTQPDINSVNGYNVSVQSPACNPVCGRFALDTNIPGPSPVINGDPIAPFTGSKEFLNNFGVPGLHLWQLDEPGAGNPNSPYYSGFYARFASQPGVSTVLDDAIARNPSFITFWVGGNDVLSYLGTGGVNDALLTDVATFQALFTSAMTKIATQTTAKGVVADIPPLAAAPTFRAVSYNAIPLDAATAGQLNANFAGFNQLIDALAAPPFSLPAEVLAGRKIQYQAGQNAVLVQDDAATDLGPYFDQIQGAGLIDAATRAAIAPYEQARQLRVDATVGPELLLLSAGAVLGTPADPTNPLSLIGLVVPLADSYTLTADEILKSEVARQTFNAIIKQVVAATNQASGGTRFALWETNSATSAISDLFGLDGSPLGLVIEGVNLAPDFSPNGVFSTDGVHPNFRGSAILANEFIDVAENAFGGTLPRVDVLNLPSVLLCDAQCLSRQ